MSQRLVGFLFALLGIILAVNASTFIVDQRNFALILQFGEIKQVVQEPGLHWKIPFMQNVRYFDNRILTIDNDDPAPFNTSDKQNVIVDSFIKWRIIDVKRFYKNFGNDAQQSIAVNRLQQSVNNALYAEIGKRKQNEVITSQREAIMNAARNRVDAEFRSMGVQIVDVRLKRVDYTQKVSESVFQRMQAERKRVANELRSEGMAENISIKADADRQRETTLAEAYRTAQEVKGSGDAEAASIYAKAYSANPEFYKFYRSLEAYKESLKNKNDVLVLKPDSEFFKYFRQSGSK